MKREFLLEFRVADQSLPKEVIDAIMAENGRDIQKVKANFADYAEVKAELSRLQQAAQEQNASAEAAAAWEEKYNRAVEEHKQQLAQMAFEKALGEGIAKARGRNARAIAALLDVDALKSSENQEAAIEATAGISLMGKSRPLTHGAQGPLEASRKNTLPLWQGHYEKNLKGSKTLWLLLLQKQRSAWPTR